MVKCKKVHISNVNTLYFIAHFLRVKNPRCLELIKYENHPENVIKCIVKNNGASRIRGRSYIAAEHTLVLPCFCFVFLFCDSNSIRQTLLKQIKGPFVVELHTSHLSLSHHRIHVAKQPCSQSVAANVLQHTIFKHTQ